MSYKGKQTGGVFRLEASVMPDAFTALLNCYWGYFHDQFDEAKRQPDFLALFAFAGFQAELAQGDVVGVNYTSDEMFPVEPILRRLAPFVNEGSWLTFLDEFGAKHHFLFTSGQVKIDIRDVTEPDQNGPSSQTEPDRFYVMGWYSEEILEVCATQAEAFKACDRHQPKTPMFPVVIIPALSGEAAKTFLRAWQMGVHFPLRRPSSEAARLQDYIRARTTKDEIALQAILSESASQPELQRLIHAWEAEHSEA